PARLGPAATRIAAIKPAAATAASERWLRTRFVDCEAAPAELKRVQLRDRLLRLFVRRHFDEREPARASCGHIAHHLDRLDGSGARKEFLELRFARFVGQISDIQLSTHELTPL